MTLSRSTKYYHLNNLGNIYVPNPKAVCPLVLEKNTFKVVTIYGCDGLVVMSSGTFFRFPDPSQVTHKIWSQLARWFKVV